MDSPIAPAVFYSRLYPFDQGLNTKANTSPRSSQQANKSFSRAKPVTKNTSSSTLSNVASKNVVYAAATRKRKAQSSVPCNCESSRYQSDVNSPVTKKQRLHEGITTKVMVCNKSTLTKVYIGTEKHSFPIHEDLLLLHSGFFRARFSELDEFAELEEEKGSCSKIPKRKEIIHIPEVDPDDFVHFFSWLYFGNSNVAALECLDFERIRTLWELGSYFQCPGFQNKCMDAYRRRCQDMSEPWPNATQIKTIYYYTNSIIEPFSKLRKFAAHSVACKNPFENTSKDSSERKEWEDLCKELPDLACEVLTATGKARWNGTLAWDDEHREVYMVEERPLGEMWEELILRKKSKKEIEREAGKTSSICSGFELAHLNRNK